MGFMRELLQDSEIFGRKTNAMISGVLSVYLLISSAGIVLQGDLLWSVYGLSVLLLVFIPPLVLKDTGALVPFEILFLLSLPFTVKGLQLGFAASHTLSYFTAATVALLIFTELDTFTSFRTTPKFTVALISVMTVAMSGVWAVARWLSDIYLGTSMIVSEYTLMWEFTAALFAGVFASGAFNIYFRRRTRRLKYEA